MFLNCSNQGEGRFGGANEDSPARPNVHPLFAARAASAAIEAKLSAGEGVAWVAQLIKMKKDLTKVIGQDGRAGPKRPAAGGGVSRWESRGCGSG